MFGSWLPVWAWYRKRSGTGTLVASSPDTSATTRENACTNGRTSHHYRRGGQGRPRQNVGHNRCLVPANRTKEAQYEVRSFWFGRAGQHTSTATPSRAATSANVAFQANTAPVFGSDFVTTVPGRSNTASKGSPRAGKSAPPAYAPASRPAGSPPS